MGNLSSVEAALAAATCPEDVFGSLGGDRLRSLTSVYRKLAMVVHPDHYQGSDQENLASELFTKLSTWRAHAERKIRANTYGIRTAPYKEPKQHRAVTPQTIKVRNRSYKVSDLVWSGDLADAYCCAYTKGS